jgi:signal transduction histidine kinase
MTTATIPPHPQQAALTHALQALGSDLSAEGIWLGLPEMLLRRLEIAGSQALPLPGLLSWLPEEERSRLASAVQPICGQGLHPPAGHAEGICKHRTPGSTRRAGPAGGTRPFYWAALPLTLEDQPQGLVLAASCQPFPAASLAEKSASLPVLVACLEHSLFRQAAHQYRSSLEALHTISLRMASTLDLQEVLNLLAESTLELLPVDGVQLYTYHPDAEPPFVFATALGRLGPGLQASDVVAPAELLRLVAARKWPLVIENLAQPGDTILPITPLLPAAGWQIGSLVAYPLLRGRLLGVFILAFLQPHSLSPEERYLLSLLADQAAVAVDNARTASNLTYRLSEMTALYRLAEKVSSNLDLESALNDIAQMIRDLFESSAVSIMAMDDYQALRRVASAGKLANLPDPTELAPGKGLAGRVALSAETIYIPDLQSNTSLQLPDPAVRSLVIVPLIAQGKMLATLSVDSYQAHAFDPADLRLLSIVAAQAAIAIQNASLYQQERRRSAELLGLVELGRLITQQMGIDQVFDVAYQAVQRLMPAEAFVISLRDRHTADTIASYLIDKAVRYPPRRSTTAGLSEYVIRTGQPVLIRDLYSQVIPFPLTHYGDPEPVHSVIAVPLRSGDEIIGMVSAQGYHPDAFAEQDLERLQSIADHITIAVQNSYLYEDLAERYQSLQRTNRSRLQSTQDISHELRSPLTFLRGYVDLLLTGEIGPLNEQQSKALAVVQARTRSLARLVDEMIEDQVGRSDRLHWQELNLRDLAEDALLLVRPAAAEKNLQLLLQAPHSIPAIPGDPDRLSQVLDNLLSNAIKFSYPGSPLVLSLQPAGEAILVSVSNQGDPIPESDQQWLFERFYRGANRQPGLGLGLSIVRQIVEQHGGQVGVDSQPELGNTFYFTLPYRQPPDKDSIE